MKLTKAQRQALTNAKEFGNAWAYRLPQVGGNEFPWTASKSAMHKTLRAAGLLDQNAEITPAGIAALAA